MVKEKVVPVCTWNFPSVKTFALILSINTLKLVIDKHVKQWNALNTSTRDKTEINIFHFSVLSHSILTFISSTDSNTSPCMNGFQKHFPNISNICFVPEYG